MRRKTHGLANMFDCLKKVYGVLKRLPNDKRLFMVLCVGMICLVFGILACIALITFALGTVASAVIFLLSIVVAMLTILVLLIFLTSIFEA